MCSLQIQHQGTFTRARLSKNNGCGNGQLQTDRVTAFSRVQLLDRLLLLNAARTYTINCSFALRLQGRPAPFSPWLDRSNKRMESQYTAAVWEKKNRC